MPEQFDWGLLEPLSDGSNAHELTGDDAYLDAMVTVERALTSAWSDTGLAPAWVADVAHSLTERGLDRAALSLATGPEAIRLFRSYPSYAHRSWPMPP